MEKTDVRSRPTSICCCCCLSFMMSGTIWVSHNVTQIVTVLWANSDSLLLGNEQPLFRQCSESKRNKIEMASLSVPCPDELAHNFYKKNTSTWLLFLDHPLLYIVELLPNYCKVWHFKNATGARHKMNCLQKLSRRIVWKLLLTVPLISLAIIWRKNVTQFREGLLKQPGFSAFKWLCATCQLEPCEHVA